MDRSALPPGTRLGELEVRKVLAVGGFGIVYLARDHSLDREVAVKEFMPAQLAFRSDDQRVSVRSAADQTSYALGLASFIDEARVLARFSHPAMVKVYRFWEANGTAYMVMPYLRGPTLMDVRRSMSEPPTERWMRSVIDPLLDALEMLHGAGFYHRDIAPDNVLISENGLPILLDFGAARRPIGGRSRSLTAIVKPHYAPIEQYAEGTNLRQGPWTDLYALAALVSYLLEGKPPPASTARAIHDERRALVQHVIPDVSDRFLAAIDWALEVRPQDRPQSVAEFRDALKGSAATPAPVRDRSAWVVAAPNSAEPARRRYPTTVRLAPAAIEEARPIAVVGWSRRFWQGGIAAAVAVVAVVTLLGQQAGPAPEAKDAPALASLRPPVAATVVVPRAEQTPVAAAASESALPAATAVARLAAAVPMATESSTRQSAQQRRRSAATRARAIGPVEMCAERNFFMRPFCVQSLCNEARFKRHGQCVQLVRSARPREQL